MSMSLPTSFLPTVVPPPSRPRRESAHLNQTRPTTIFDNLPCVIAIRESMLLMQSSGMTSSRHRVRVRPVSREWQMTMDRTSPMAPFVPRMAFPARFRVVNSSLPMRSSVVPKGQFFRHSPARPTTRLRVSPVSAPVVVLPVAFPPNVRPVPNREPILPRARLGPSIECRGDIVGRIYFRHRTGQPFLCQDCSNGNVASTRHVAYVCVCHVSSKVCQVAVVTCFRRQQAGFQGVRFVRV